MPFGFSVLNDYSEVQIDSKSPLLQYRGSGEVNSGAIAYFPAPVKSQTPPLIFAKPVSGALFLFALKFIGSPGNWTGFVVQATTNQWHNHGLAGRTAGRWKYLVADWEVAPSGEAYGLQVFGPDGKLTYDAGGRHIELMNYFTTWTYGYRSQKNGYLFVMHYLDLGSSSTLDHPSNYVLLNPFMAEVLYAYSGDDNLTRRKIKIGGSQLISVMQTNLKSLGNKIEPGIIGRLSN